jgi:hypothetical protein
VSVDAGVSVGVAVFAGVSVAEGDGVLVGDAVAEPVGVGVSVAVGEAVAAGVSVGVSVAVSVGVAVAVAVSVGVSVGVSVAVSVGVSVGVSVVVSVAVSVGVSVSQAQTAAEASRAESFDRRTDSAMPETPAIRSRAMTARRRYRTRMRYPSKLACVRGCIGALEGDVQVVGVMAGGSREDA